ncbi:glucan biosynthesis protein D, partial [Staphylococcus aureus]|nr:glucan biosynthesis protein D [Staphylococcus aureus]
MAAVLSAAAASALAQGAGDQGFFEQLAKEAAALAAKPHRPTQETARLPEVLKKLSYDGARDIRYK